MEEVGLAEVGGRLLCELCATDPAPGEEDRGEEDGDSDGDGHGGGGGLVGGVVGFVGGGS